MANGSVPADFCFVSGNIKDPILFCAWALHGKGHVDPDRHRPVVMGQRTKTQDKSRARKTKVTKAGWGYDRIGRFCGTGEQPQNESKGKSHAD